MIKNKFVHWGKPNLKETIDDKSSDLDNKVKTLREERIKILQREVVEITLEKNNTREITPILNEINKLRNSLKMIDDGTKTENYFM